MGLRLLPFLLFSSLALAADFPESWVGTYEGEVTGAALPTTMRLTIERRTNERYRWAIQYSGEPERNYELIAMDAKAGKYVIDEKNGIVIDNFYRGGVLHSMFTVAGKLIVFQYELTEAGMRIDSPSFSATPSRFSGTEALPVNSFPLLNIQRGLLPKK